MRKVSERLLCHTPRDNWRLLRRKLWEPPDPANTIAPALMAERAAAREYLGHRTRGLREPVLLLGGGPESALLASALASANVAYAAPNGRDAGDCVARAPASPKWRLPADLAGVGDIVVCPWPETPDDWREIARLRASLPNRVLTFQELLLPMSLLVTGRRSFEYRFETLAEMVPYYSGRDELGPLGELAQVYPIRGKRVIEFGPMDGHQTAALVNLGASSVTCVEARAENALKTLTAKAAFGWSNVEVVMDDFHNVSAASYGHFDLAFAHGVYYHSFAPFLFFENLFSLADSIFFGGYIATDDYPEDDYERLEHRGETYRAKRHGDGHGMAQGVNLFGYFFAADDLQRLFQRDGYRLTHLSSEEQTPGQPQGRYLRFLATKG